MSDDLTEDPIVDVDPPTTGSSTPVLRGQQLSQVALAVLDVALHL